MSADFMKVLNIFIEYVFYYICRLKHSSIIIIHVQKLSYFLVKFEI